MLYSDMDLMAKANAINEFVKKFGGADIALINFDSVKETLDEIEYSGDWVFDQDGNLYRTEELYSLEDLRARAKDMYLTKEERTGRIDALNNAIEQAKLLADAPCKDLADLDWNMNFQCIVFDEFGDAIYV